MPGGRKLFSCCMDKEFRALWGWVRDAAVEGRDYLWGSRTVCPIMMRRYRQSGSQGYQTGR